MTDVDTPTVPDRGPTVLAALVLQILAIASAGGMHDHKVLVDFGLDLEQLTEPHGYISALAVERFVCATVQQSADPLLGLHSSEIIELPGFGVTGYIMQACSSVQEMIELAIRYEELVSNVGRVSLRFQPGAALWCWDCKTGNDVFRQQAIDFILGCFRTIYLRWVRSPSLPIARVFLQHGPPSDPALIREYLRVFGCPVYFNQPVSALVLPVEALRLPLANPDAVLQEVLEVHARTLLEQKKRSASIVERARVQLRSLLRQGNASREALAEALGVSVHQLYRQLDQEETSYQRLLDVLRFELASQYLSQGGDSINAVAARLQFAESQSFIRWFRKASGVTPGQFRKDAGQK